MRRPWMRVLVLAGIASLSFVAAQSELAAGFATRFRAEVLEEAQNALGTHFILLGPLRASVAPMVVQTAVMQAVAAGAAGSVVVVFPSSRYARDGGSHEAAVVLTRANGGVFARSVDWANHVLDDDALDVSELVFSFGSSTRLADRAFFARERPATRAATPSPPRNGCVSSTTASGSSMTCYSDGRVSYRSSCTNVGGRISCRSESY